MAIQTKKATRIAAITTTRSRTRRTRGGG